MNSQFARAQDGDPAAVAAVVEHLRPRLTRMAGYYARCAQENADDLLQEAWLGLLDALSELDMEIGSPEQYLIQRARWRLLDAVKRGRRPPLPAAGRGGAGNAGRSRLGSGAGRGQSSRIFPGI